MGDRHGCAGVPYAARPATPAAKPGAGSRPAPVAVLEAVWRRGLYARLGLLTVAGTVVWLVLVPVAVAVIMALVNIAALVAGMAAGGWVVGKLTSPAAVQLALHQLTMGVLLLWVASLVLTARCTWRLARNRAPTG